MIFRARQFEYVFPRPSLVMGILNVTPDSFSDGGKFLDAEAAVTRGLEMAEQGADIIDVGGESTRPGAHAVSETEELERVIPVIQRLAARTHKAISVDTMKPGVARAAIDAGASIINDVGTCRADVAMGQLVAETGAGYILMHMKGTPADMQRGPAYIDAVCEVNDFFGLHLKRLAGLGVQMEQMTIDVGVGFGKRLEDNLQLLAGLGQFTKWERPMVLGASRKSFIGQLLGAAVEDRLAGSLACACWAVQNGVQIVRTHDVAATWQSLRMTEALIARR